MTDRPNVIVFFTDQQRWDTVGAYGNPLGLTPNLDEAADSGAVLEQAITPQPVCAPARGCLQTGQYATTHGVWRNRKVLDVADEMTLAGTFARNGYETGYVGKWHLSGDIVEPIPRERRAGYRDYWIAADLLEFTSQPYEGRLFDGRTEPVDFDGYRVDALTDLAIDFVERDHDAPFFLFLSHLEPHHQNDLETYVAPDGYAHRYRDPAWVPPDLQGTPGDWYSELPDYYGICRRLDECYGRLLAALEGVGCLDDTIVLFTSDHGCHFRTRNEEYKRSCHEASVRVPAVFRGPGFENAGRVTEPVSLVDIAPTLLDFAGIDPPSSMEGQTIRPLVEGDGGDWKDEVFIQISESEVGRALRTDRWKYSVTAPDADGWDDAASETYVERYLYDLDADPYEQTNLIGCEDYRDIADDLSARLRERIEAIEGATPAIRPAGTYP